MGGAKFHGTCDVNNVHGAKSLRAGVTHADALRRRIKPGAGDLAPDENTVNEGAFEQVESLNRILLGNRMLKHAAADGILRFQQDETAHMQNCFAGGPPLPSLGAIRIAQER